MSELLVALQKSGHPDLPADARTLVGTPTTIEMQTLSSGTYAHHDLEKALREQLVYIDTTYIPSKLQIMISTDGLPLSKSSKSDLWPILGRLVGVGIDEPFLIAAFYGSGKPSSAHEFLGPFLTEYSILHNEGFVYENWNYTVQIHAVVADTPARNFITCFPAHNSRCAKCTQPGQTVNGRRLFLDTDPISRTEATFREGLPTQFKNNSLSKILILTWSNNSLLIKCTFCV